MNEWAVSSDELKDLSSQKPYREIGFQVFLNTEQLMGRL